MDYAIFFLRACKNGMIVDDLLEMEFDGIPNTLNNESISPMKYLLAYTDGELLDVYIRSSKRKSVSEFYNDHYASVIFDENKFEHYNQYETYSLKCNWHNVKVLSEILHLIL